MKTQCMNRDGAKLAKKMRRNAKIGFLIALFASVASSRTGHAESLIKDGDVLAICGDSITEQRQYSAFIENYLIMCQPAKVSVMQFGWSGESAPRFADRLKWDILAFKPTIATTCYGMNDGNYKPIEDATKQNYNKAMSRAIEQFKEANVRVIVGSPGAVDPQTFKRFDPVVYNQTLAALRDEAKTLAESTGNTFANVHDPMVAATTAAEQKYGPAYHVCGPDGYHPAANGHLVMAYAFLKAMGFDGNIGTIEVDLDGKTATASAGHQVSKIDGNAITIESTQYPFCFSGRPDDPAATSGIVEFVPFNQDLNRLTLKATGTGSRYRVTWGEESKEYVADQLKQGVNLAADFPNNPFKEAFFAVDKKVREKQMFQTKFFKNLIHNIGDARAQLGDDPAFTATFEAIKSRDAAMADEIAKSKLPVTHTITIELVK